MEIIVCVPGIEGSRLSLHGEEVWPPTLEELITNYDRLQKIMDPAVVVTEIVKNVECFPIYQPLIDDLAEIAQRSGARAIEFPYDWRKNIVTEGATKLAQLIETQVAGGATAVSLIAHSMGALVVRHVLESGSYSNAPWFPKITRFVAICGPHLGAPTSLTKATGLEGTSGVSASDTKTFAANPAYPSAYQCLPVYGTYVLFDEVTQKWKNFYNHGVAQSLGLNLTNLDVARASWDSIGLDKKPPNVSYYFISGMGQKTEEVVELFASGQRSVYSDDDGDGTVPKWSADSPKVAHFSTPGDHIGILAAEPFRQILYRIFGQVTVAAVRAAPKVLSIKVSVDRSVQTPGAPMNVLLIPEHPAASLNGALRLERGTERVLVSETPINYQGQPIAQLRLELSAPRNYGAYVLSFVGTTHQTAASRSAAFVVSRSASAVQISPTIRFKPSAAGVEGLGREDENLP